MRYRFLGNSGLEVSEICFGVMTFTGKKGWTNLAEVSQKEANYLTTLAIDKGVNFFDTADIYSSGISEEILGKALSGKRREAVITTKCGFEMYPGPNGNGLSRRRVIEACEDSLKRLKTDYIDVYMIHSFDFIVPLEETMSAMDHLVKQGKVRYIGCSNFPAWQLIKAMFLSEKNGWEKFINIQSYYSLLGTDIESELVPACVDQGIGITVWSPLHGGILTGKYRSKNFPKGTRLKKPGDHLPYNIEQGNLILDEVERIALARKKTMSQVSLNYLLRKEGIDSVVIGARNKKQLIENIGSSGWELTPEEVSELDKVSKPAKNYPAWYYDIFRNERMDKDKLFYKNLN